MSVYVDQTWYHGVTPRMPYPRSCHMMADTRAELMAFAAQLGLKPEWLHHDHFDIVPSKRALAKKLGALEMPSDPNSIIVKARFIRRIRKQWQAEEISSESTNSS